MDILIHVDSLNLKILWLLKNCADVFVTFAIHDLYEAAPPGCRGCWLQVVLAPRHPLFSERIAFSFQELHQLEMSEGYALLFFYFQL